MKKELETIVHFNSPKYLTCLTSKGRMFLRADSVWVEVEPPELAEDAPESMNTQNGPDTIPFEKKANRKQFEGFWARYPKKLGKVDAYKVWKSKKLDNSLESIITGLKLWQQYEGWTAEDGKYITYCAKWLRNEMWKENPLPETMEPQQPAGPNLRERFFNSCLQTSTTE